MMIKFIEVKSLTGKLVLNLDHIIKVVHVRAGEEPTYMMYLSNGDNITVYGEYEVAKSFLLKLGQV